MGRLALSVFLLISTAAEADPIYKWVDSSGEAHYTNDPSTIPAKQKTEVTQGEEIGEILTRSPPHDGGSAASRTELPKEPTRSTIIEASGDEPGPDEGVSTAEAERSWRERFHKALARVNDREARLADDQQLAASLNDDESTVFQSWDGGVETTRSPRAEARARVEQDRRDLSRARDSLDDLEREASAQAIPRAWRQ